MSEQAIASARGDALGEVFRSGPLAQAAEAGAKLAQPGGEMQAIVRWAGDRPADVKIRGRVKMVAVGEAFVDIGEMDGAQFHV